VVTNRNRRRRRSMVLAASVRERSSLLKWWMVRVDNRPRSAGSTPIARRAEIWCDRRGRPARYAIHVRATHAVGIGARLGQDVSVQELHRPRPVIIAGLRRLIDPR